MAAPPNFFYSPHQPIDAGDDEAAARNWLSRKKSKRPVSQSPNVQSHHSTTRSAVCKLSASQTDRINQEYAHSLIGWVVGKDIEPLKLARHLRRHLRLTNLPQVFGLGLGYFVLKFSKTDFGTLKGNPWTVPNLCIYVFPWTPNFKPSEATNFSIDAWIRLHELPIEYYNEEIFRAIAETIGESLVEIDRVTKDCTKCKFARICVRINLCDPLLSTITIGSIRQDIEYEGFDLVCPLCRRVVHLKHDCSNSSGSCRFEPHYRGARSFQDVWSTSNSKPPLISSQPSVACGSRFEVLGTEWEDPLPDMNDLPTPSVGDSEEAATRISTSSLQPQLPDLVAEQLENHKEDGGVSVQTLANLPEESSLQEDLPQSQPISISSNLEEASSSTISAPVLEQNNLDQSPTLAPSFVEDHFTSANLNQSPALAPSFVEDHYTAANLNQSPALAPSFVEDHFTAANLNQSPALAPSFVEDHFTTANLSQSPALPPSPVEDWFTAAETSCSTTVEVHNNQPQRSPSAPSNSTLQPPPTSKAIPTFCSSGIERSILLKEITNTPSHGLGINRRPILYTIDGSIKSFEIGLSESPNSAPKQNQFVISMVSSPRSGNTHGIGSKKMLGWNFRGMDNANLIEGLKYMVQKYETSIVVVFATRISDDVEKKLVEELGLQGSYCKKFDDYHGGVWLLMFRQDVPTEVFVVNAYNTQEVSTSTYFHSRINEASPQTWGPASTYSMANALAY